jgi:hypothetical protein
MYAAVSVAGYIHHQVAWHALTATPDVAQCILAAPKVPSHLLHSMCVDSAATVCLYSRRCTYGAPCVVAGWAGDLDDMAVLNLAVPLKLVVKLQLQYTAACRQQSATSVTCQ